MSSTTIPTTPSRSNRAYPRGRMSTIGEILAAKGHDNKRGDVLKWKLEQIRRGRRVQGF